MLLQNLEVIEWIDGDIDLAEAFANLGNAVNTLTAEHDLSLVKQYWLKIAPPSELVDYIISQPNHTWHGITIYPGEAWRYRDTDLWITWRTYQSEMARKLRTINRGGPVDWSEEWIP
jgi:hypothetical protein